MSVAEIISLALSGAGAVFAVAYWVFKTDHTAVELGKLTLAQEETHRAVDNLRVEVAEFRGSTDARLGALERK